MISHIGIWRIFMISFPIECMKTANSHRSLAITHYSENRFWRRSLLNTMMKISSRNFIIYHGILYLCGICILTVWLLAIVIFGIWTNFVVSLENCKSIPLTGFLTNNLWICLSQKISLYHNWNGCLVDFIPNFKVARHHPDNKGQWSQTWPITSLDNSIITFLYWINISQICAHSQ